MTGDSIYDDAVNVTREYLGPAADRFIDRQVRNHLQKKPESITAHDLIKLIDWIRVAVASLTDDNRLIDDYAAKLERVATGGIPASKG